MNDLERVQRDQKIAEDNGFILKKPIYTLGTPVNALGITNYKTSRIRYEDLPLLDDVINNFNKIIEDEKRIDYEHDLITLNYLVDNILVTSDENELIPSQWALRQLVEKSRPNSGPDHEAALKAANYVSDLNCPLWLRKNIVNYYLSHAVKKDKPISAKFRTRIVDNSKRELFAVLSKKYNTDCDVNELGKLVLRKFTTSQPKADLMYDGNRFKLIIWYHSDITTPVAGEIFKAGVIIQSSDDGSRGISVTPTVWRNLCLNFIVLDKASQRVSFTHLRSDLYKDISEAIENAINKVSSFANIWDEANKEKIISSIYDDANVERVLMKLINAGHIRIAGYSKEELLERTMRAWRLEPGYTKASIINAITRAAHNEDWKSPWASSELEEQAGQILYNKVIRLD